MAANIWHAPRAARGDAGALAPRFSADAPRLPPLHAAVTVPLNIPLCYQPATIVLVIATTMTPAVKPVVGL
jgi:hypothetical protein